MIQKVQKQLNQVAISPSNVGVPALTFFGDPCFEICLEANNVYNDEESDLLSCGMYSSPAAAHLFCKGWGGDRSINEI